jgi:hypothetical protein
MTTRSELRARIRTELNDAGTTPLWSDGALNQWIDEAIRDYGEHLPKEASATLISVADQASYTLPTDFDRALRVEHPDGMFRVPLRMVGGDIAPGNESVVGGPCIFTYDVWADQIVLDPAPTAAGETIRLRYLAIYSTPSSDGATLATPTRDDALLVWSVCTRALRWIDTDESKRQRFERQRGVSAQQAASHYEQALQASYDQRLRRVRPSRLVRR